MIYAILIGYKYLDTIDELLGVDIDLHRMFNYTHNTLNIPLDNIKIITDIKSLGDVGCNKFLCLDEDMKIFLDILDSLGDCMKCDNLKIFLYYSGHGISMNNKQYMVLPGKQLLSEDVVYQCLKKFRKNVEIFSIIDSCYRSIITLPYVLNDIKKQNENDYPSKIICFSSSNYNEKSVSTSKGSVFTEALIHYLSTNSEHKLSEIRNSMRSLTQLYNQTAMVTVSDPEIVELWPWIYKNKDVCPV